MTSLTQSQLPKGDPSDHVPVLPADLTDEQGCVRLTNKAIAMAKQALVKRGTPSAALRVGVRGGGCSGGSYAKEFADKIR